MSSLSARYELISYHSTVLYYDSGLSRLRHGASDKVPHNLVLEVSDGFCRFLFASADSRSIARLHLTEEAHAHLGLDGTVEILQLRGASNGQVALLVGDNFLSADRDGLCRADRKWCKEWEQYTLVPAHHFPQPASKEEAEMQDDRIVEVAHEGIISKFFIANPNDHIQQFHLNGRFYELRQLMMHLECIPLGSTVLDVGSNVGNHSIFYGTHSWSSKIYPFEPNPEAREILAKNVTENSSTLKSKIDMRYCHYALGSQSSRLVIDEFQRNNLGGTKFRTSDSADIGVTCAALDDLSIEGIVGFMKIDVEGMELDVLSGARKTIDSHRPVIFIEVIASNEKRFWSWTRAENYRPVGATYNYLGIKNYLIIPES